MEGSLEEYTTLMVDAVGTGPSPAQIQQQANIAQQQQEARARNEQTQPREAPAASSQNSNNQRSLQARDDQKRNQEVVFEQKDEAKAADKRNDNRRGQYLDLIA